MRNDNARWALSLGLDRPAIQTAVLTMSIVRTDRQMLISGPIQALLDTAGISSAVGWPEPATGETYAIRLRRDRILVMNGPEIEDGWHDAQGIAVNDVTDGYCVIELSGDMAMPILKRGTEIDPADPSNSVVRGFGGYPVMVYAFQTSDRFRIHVPRTFLEGLWSLIEGYVKSVSTAGP